MTSVFKRMRQLNGRYVRLYSSCDNPGFNDDVIAASFEAHIGIYALVWFGYVGEFYIC